MSPNLRKEKHEKPTGTKLAQDFFDTHYKQVYGSDWHRIRVALLSKPKFAALVNNFSEKEETIEKLESFGCLNIKNLFNAGKTTKN